MDNKAYVTSTVSDGINTIEFFTPAHNSLPGDILSKIKDEIERASSDSETKVVILKSAGDRTFCAGASFDELMNIDSEQSGKEFFMGFAQVINACRKCDKIIIGRFQGKAVGGGVGLISAVDYAIGSKYTSIRLSELAIGIGPFVIGPAVERKVGKSAFAKLALTPDEWQTAQWALDHNLLHEKFDTIEQIDAYVDDLAHRLASYNPQALKELKKVIWAGTEDWDKLLEERAQMSGTLVLSDFTKNAINSFKNKA